MIDPIRSDRRPTAADVSERDRDAQIEGFLLTGLDHYFAEQYELAISVWTRVLFIDRGHARARAYIERARSAVAERQRKGDELLHTGSAAFDRGDAGVARQLVESAVQHGASADEALALMARIDRLENAGQASAAAARRAVEPVDAPVPSDVVPRSARWKWIGAGIVAGALLGAAALALMIQGRPSWALFGAPDTLPVSTLNAPLPVPSIGEVALSRAQGLYARGRLQEALVALGDVPNGDPHRTRADELAASIQRQLLAAARTAGRARAEGAPRRP